ncbi:MAG: hypothetical protein CMJ93_04805 [Planctomycetes bacterium]|nr:hypothetical protein [Planctomycetota bacterium]
MSNKFQARRERTDRTAALLVKLGGIGVVAVVFFMALFLILQAAPLASNPEMSGSRLGYKQNYAADREVIARGVEPFVEASYALFADGELALFSLETSKVIDSRQIKLKTDELITDAQISVTQGAISFLSSDSRLGQMALKFKVKYADDLSRHHQFADTVGPVTWLLNESSQPVIDFSISNEEQKVWGGVVFADGSARLIRATEKTNRLTGERSSKLKSLELEAAAYSKVALLESGVITLVQDGTKVKASRPDRRFTELLPAGEWLSATVVNDLLPLIGDGSVIAVAEGAQLNRLLLQGQEIGASQLIRVNSFDASAIGKLDEAFISPRQRVLFARGDKQTAVIHGTTGSIVAMLEHGAPQQSQLAPRENAVVEFFDDGGIAVNKIDLGFIAENTAALFGKLQYEGLRESSYTWQSTGGSDSYESKISFIPLIIGTLKGAFWALLPSIPLALLAALYCSRFLRGRLREVIKPAIELLAGIPSVILGFIGALYLAPAIEDRFLSLFLLPVVLGVLALGCGAWWSHLSLSKRRHLHEGSAAFLLIPIFFIASWAVFAFGPEIEQLLLGMPFREWAPEALGVPFEQRNSIVVGLAMGFAVAPLIFTLAEDAFRNIPKDLSDASLALGATQWQTATRVILPPAIPGVVAAIMLGLGRAVGETMVVLMATGNTPITDWNPLQGFRSLAANLAVELPEAEHGGGLYRVLFLSALLLFAITFVVNTLAEIIRVKGRKNL